MNNSKSKLQLYSYSTFFIYNVNDIFMNEYLLFRMRFNEDLNSRQIWFPMVFGDYRFCVLEWWENTDNHMNYWRKESNEEFEKVK